MNLKYKITYHVGSSTFTREVIAPNIFKAISEFNKTFPEALISEVIVI